MARRRQVNIFSLSFLDIMSCGFGAVILIFLIINHATEEETREVNKDRLAEIRMLDYQVQQGELTLFELQEQLDDVGQRLDASDSRLVSVRSTLDRRRDELQTLSRDSIASRESLEALKSDIETREEELERLRALEAAADGGRIRSFSGDGDRQYLTGLKIGGSHILIALDTSASMLDSSIVNVLRRRNMNDEQKRAAPKWQRAVRTVEWLSAQLPLDANFQIYGFATDTRSLLDPERNGWVPLGDGRALNAGLEALRGTVPDGGSSLISLANAIRGMEPRPDNVYLITDSLPTQGDRPPRGNTVSGRDRMRLFSDALARIPGGVPINVILFPMEGDPMAAAAYWTLAYNTRGSFMSPSQDWP